MEPEWLKALLLWGACIVLAATLERGPLSRALGRLRHRLQTRFIRPVVLPASRPIELIAQDARRLGRRFRQPPPGVSFVKFEGTRRAYDKVLSEGCCALG